MIKIKVHSIVQHCVTMEKNDKVEVISYDAKKTENMVE